MAEGQLSPQSSDDVPVSTPLHRAAGRLQSALPAGWQVEVVDAADGSPDGGQILRALLVTE
ncbi:hypothetical protein [Nocardia carnea]|uniref:Uncharacterized protein n=1 Tax=Nocardia carnea TaxID=37328 RepID=A0ABW7TVK1_9NOCA|nr:hypothetical protein [Nocardia carnea]